jgi:chromosome partition protein MukE
MNFLMTRPFAELDTALRRGRHIPRQDFARFDLVWQNYETLENFYSAFSCKLVQHPDGFYYLLPSGDLVPTRKLSRAAMHLGQFIALKTRDPDITRTNGLMDESMLIADLEASVPSETLGRIYAPGSREGMAGDRIRKEIERSLALLDELGFVRRADGSIRATEAIHRFSELARHRNSPNDMERLRLEIQRGVVLDSPADTDEDNGNE